MAKPTKAQAGAPARLPGNGSFFFAVAIAPVLLLTFAGTGLYAAAERGPVQFTAASSRYIYFWVRKKDTIARETTGSRVMLFGGSSVLYSVRARSLALRLKRPVVNMGLHAGLGLDYIFYRARNELRRGDTAVLFLEYGLYVKDSDWTLADYVIPFDLAYLARAGPSQAIDLLGKLTPAEYFRKIWGGWFGTPEVGTQVLAAIDASGDFVANRRSEMGDAQRSSIGQGKPTVGSMLSTTQTARIAAFLDWCRQSGVNVVAAFPAIVDRPDYHLADRLGFFRAVEGFYDRQGIPRLGDAGDFMFGPESFYDSAYHLHDEAAEMMTALVAQRLVTMGR